MLDWDGGSWKSTLFGLAVVLAILLVGMAVNGDF